MLLGGVQYILTFYELKFKYLIQFIAHMSKKNFTWKNIIWHKVESRIFKLQQRIYNASLNGNKVKVMFLQKLLIRSLDAKLLAVKRVTTENRGRKAAGKLYRSHAEKIKLVKKLKVDGKANLIKRVEPGKSEMRPLGMPVIKDRAKQYLVLLALEPEWEAKFEPNSYGFRPGRCCQDAVASIFGHLRVKSSNPRSKKYILDADIKGCFDNIKHKYLLDKLDTLPEIQNQIKTWLEAGIVENDPFPSGRDVSAYGENNNQPDLTLKPPGLQKKPPGTLATPTLPFGGFKNEIGSRRQGNIISPLLANVALHGMENFLKEWVLSFPEYGVSKRNRMKKIGVIRYANDFVIIHPKKEILLQAKLALSKWFKDTSGLELNEARASIVCSTEGFSFLGYRFINVVRHNKTRIKIYPEASSVKRVISEIGDICRSNRSISSYDLILRLKPIILGWCNYYSNCECSYIFNKLDHLTFRILRAWVFRRDRVNNRTKVKQKYFPNGNTYVYRGNTHQDNWILVGTKKLSSDRINKVFLPRFSWHPSLKYVKIQSSASIYDGDEKYWTKRTYEFPGFSYSQRRLLKLQKGHCAWCKSPIRINHSVEIDHIIPKSKSGKQTYDNLQLLHIQCHIEKTALDSRGERYGAYADNITEWQA